MSEQETNISLDNGTGGGLGSELKQSATDVSAKAKEKIDEAAGLLSDRAQSFGAQQKNLGAEQIKSFAGAVHMAAGELEAQMPGAASLAHSTADRLDAAAVALRERNINQLLNDIGEFARREPALFFGGAVAVGFALTRVLKSSVNSARVSDESGTDAAGSSVRQQTAAPQMPTQALGGYDGL